MANQAIATEHEAVAPSTVEGTASCRMRWVPPFELDESQTLGYAEAISRIEAAYRLGIDPSLDPIRALMSELGDPQSTYDCIQVAGTNGKTSTTRYTAAMLMTVGKKVGVYTSPHLVEYTERVEVDGAPVTSAIFALGISWALAGWRRLTLAGDPVTKGGITEFELLTAAAFVMYALEGVDVAVLEVGLGGRWDATSVCDPKAVAITGIGLDHTKILGDTLAAIASEKAAIIHGGAPVVLGTGCVRDDEVLKVMMDTCRGRGVNPYLVIPASEYFDGELPMRVEQVDLGTQGVMLAVVTSSGNHPLSGTIMYRGSGHDILAELEFIAKVNAPGLGFNVRVPLVLEAPGAAMYQDQNICCAMMLASAYLGHRISEDEVNRALGNCPVPGRFQVLRQDPLIIIDACHNPQSAMMCAHAIGAAFPDRKDRPTLLIGALADKDHAGIVSILAPLFDRIVVTASQSERAFPAAELAHEVEVVTGRKPLAVCETLPQALRMLCGESFVGCGTITLIGEIAAYF